MPWVTFTGRFHWMPPEKKGHLSVVYEAGQTLNVPRAAAEAARAAGKARPARKTADDE